MYGFAKLSLLGLLLSAYATPAQAQVEVSCSGTALQTWTPGIQLFPRDVIYTFSATYDQCETSNPSITAAAIALSAPLSYGCSPRLEPAQASITWNDGSTSTFEFQPVNVSAGGVTQTFTNVGKVKSGRFQGSEVTFVNVFVNTNPLACLSPEGLTRLAGSSTLLFTRLVPH